MDGPNPYTPFFVDPAFSEENNPYSTQFTKNDGNSNPYIRPKSTSKTLGVQVVEEPSGTPQKVRQTVKSFQSQQPPPSQSRSIPQLSNQPTNRPTNRPPRFSRQQTNYPKQRKQQQSQKQYQKRNEQKPQHSIAPPPQKKNQKQQQHTSKSSVLPSIKKEEISNPYLFLDESNPYMEGVKKKKNQSNRSNKKNQNYHHSQKRHQSYNLPFVALNLTLIWPPYLLKTKRIHL